MFRNTQRYSELPPAENGYELDPYKSFFSIVVPTGVDVTNLIVNPSFETGIATMFAQSCTMTRDSVQQRRGLWAVKMVPTANFCYVRGDNSNGLTGITLTINTLYYFSADVLAPAGTPMTIEVTNTVNATLGSYAFIGTGSWQRVSLPYYELTGAARFVRVTQNSSNRQPIWTDGWQLEVGGLTTYIDGDQTGFLLSRSDYYWNGIAHASTSVRVGQSRHGGREIPLGNYGFRLSGIMGMGMGGRINQITPIANGGAFYSQSTVADRQFALVGMLYGNTLIDLQRKRRALIDAFKDDVVSPDQPVRLFYQQTDEDGNIVSAPAEVVCVVDGDPLVGKTDNLFGEAMVLTFRQLNPWMAKEIGNVGASLLFSSTVANSNAIDQRSANGVWSSLSNGATGGNVYAIIRGLDGKIYVGGNFTAVNNGGVPVPNTQSIAVWDGNLWAAVGAGVSSGAATVDALAVDAAGNIYAGGTFTAMSGVANTTRIAKWNGATWSAMGTGANNTVRSITVGADGSIYAFGNFTLMGGVANTKYAAKWDGAVWTPLSIGLNGGTGAFCSVRDDKGGIWVGGDFANIPGNPTVGNLAYWTGTAWLTTGSGIATGGGALIYALVIGPDKRVYLGGDFTAFQGVAAANIASTSYLFTTALPLGSGVSAGLGSTPVQALGFDQFGLMYVLGDFTIAGGLAVTSGFAIWNGTSYLQSDFYPSAGSTGGAVLSVPDGRLFLGHTGTGNGTGTAQNSVANTGSSVGRVKIVVTGPGTLWRMWNTTTAKTLYFNLVLVAGEVVTLDLSDPTGITMQSSIRGNILNALVGGSTPTDFFLNPGTNNIMFFMTGTSGASAVTLQWTPTHHSLDTLIPVALGV